MIEPFASVGKSRLYASDICDFLVQYDGRPFDVTITSPPYNLKKEYTGFLDTLAWEEYLQWIEKWAKLLLERTSPHGRLCINVPIDSNLNGHVPFDADITRVLMDVEWQY